MSEVITQKLKESILSLVRARHSGRENAITVRDIENEFLHLFLEAPREREIRRIIRELNFEGHPILTSVHAPYGVYYAETQGEIEEYLCNLGSRMRAILERMKAIDRIKTQNFLKGQLELFG